MYIELKTGYNDNGPAWIGQVKFSQSGRTVYFNGHALKRSGGGGGSNHYDLETSDGYWVSGIKKDGTDRHWAGSGKIMIEARVVDEYLKLTGEDKLDTSRFEVTTNIADTDIQRFHEKENKSL
jgi:hypothetical protein